ncbi:MAG: DUF5989 family protein [Paracoccaceae bacterium]|jgi:hypothetical protein|nr:hypothetical protein [Gammaproteobacteria bacterium]MDA0827151.1 DUF5989 family protein [Pseudomonadota bacterium]MDA7591065.1 DUF5989 family protein [Pseudomonadales bacterium]MDG1257334.1 DUF5989 family protein [Paracoccaceae bacterium]MCH9819855.1 hypothetical protein [Gammaproteobacteria bacterium]|tara:strand:- start:107 stop:256 length:150 start_codon:yes stop_codon:yes gene_type:complete
MAFLKELLAFLRARKKLWLAPIILIMVALGGLMILAEGSVLAPFIYTLF